MLWIWYLPTQIIWYLFQFRVTFILIIHIYIIDRAASSKMRHKVHRNMLLHVLEYSRHVFTLLFNEH
jgi:hypothetical protein